MKYSPLPWKLDNGRIFDAKNKRINIIPSKYTTDGEDEANFKLIVDLVNEYHEKYQEEKFKRDWCL